MKNTFFCKKRYTLSGTKPKMQRQVLCTFTNGLNKGCPYNS